MRSHMPLVKRNTIYKVSMFLTASIIINHKKLKKVKNKEGALFSLSLTLS